MNVSDGVVEVTNALLIFFGLLFLGGLGWISYMWMVRKEGPKGNLFPIASETNGLGALSNPL